MDNVWLVSALWLGLALAASVISIWVGISVALIEIMVGAVAGNTVGLTLAPWVNYLAGFGAILLTFLAGAEIDAKVVRKNLWSSMTIGVMGFFAPYLGVSLFARFVADWPWPQAQIAGISLSTTSVAVVYAVMVETGLNRTEIGKIILAACFINDLGTVLALGLIFANYNVWLAAFAGATAVCLWFLPRFSPWFFSKVGHRVSEPETKFIALILFFLGGMGSIADSEAVLPAYLVGMVLAPTFQKDPGLAHRMRVVAFTILTPFYFLKAGSLVDFQAVIAGAGLIGVFLALKMATKFVGILPLTRVFNFGRREGMYTTLLMSTGLTFGTISALYGLTNHIIDQHQYTILVTAVIASAVVPTLIAQRWFEPSREPAAVGQEDPMPMTKILLANDGSEGAFKALGTAISLAKHYQAELHMICVEELPMLPTTIDEVIEEREEANHRYEKVIERAQSLCYMQDVDVSTHVVYGHPVPSIIDFIQKHGIDHLVIGFMGHSAIYNRLIGGKSDKLVRLAPCSITVVK